MCAPRKPGQDQSTPGPLSVSLRHACMVALGTIKLMSMLLFRPPDALQRGVLLHTSRTAIASLRDAVGVLSRLALTAGRTRI